MDPITDGAETAESDDSDPVERIADPENYNLRRRLKQLHDAKELVKETKTHAVMETARNPREFSHNQRDKFVAEVQVDYIHDLATILEQTGDLEDFLAEEIESPDLTLTIQEYTTSRGTDPNDNEPVNYAISMAAWRICNDYFEKVAGTELEQSGYSDQAGFTANFK